MSSDASLKRIFLLSPANLGGIRARRVMSDTADFALARQLRTAEGAMLGEVFSFVSGLYFRGKLAYARHFTRPPDPGDPVVAGGILVITPNAGLRAADVYVTRESLQASAGEPIDIDNLRYRRPLERSARSLRRVSTQLREWNRNGAHAAALRQFDARLHALCARVDAADGQRATCDALSKPEAKKDA